MGVARIIPTMSANPAVRIAPTARLTALRALALATIATAAWTSRAAVAANQQAPAAPAGQSSPDPKSIEIPGPIKAEPSEVNFGIVEPINRPIFPGFLKIEPDGLLSNISRV